MFRNRNILLLIKAYLKALLALIHHWLEQHDQFGDHLPPPEHEADDEEPCEEPQLLVGESHVLLRRASAAVPEVLTAEDGLVEDVGLGEVRRVARPLVLSVVELGDPSGDLTNFPPPEPRLHQLLAVLLLQFPELGIDLERLVEIRIVPETIQEGNKDWGSRSPPEATKEKQEGVDGIWLTDSGRRWGDREP